MAIEKEKMAIYAVIGLVVVATILYAVYEFGGGENNTAEEGTSSSVAFEAPSNNPDQIKKEKEKYKSSLDVYEQNHEYETEEKEEVNLGFNKIAQSETNNSDIPSGIPKQQQKVVYKEKNHTYISSGSTSKNQQAEVSQSSEQLQPVVSTKKKGLISATDNSNNNTAVLAADVSIPVVFHGDQTIVNGGPVKLRTTKACTINGKTVQAGTVIGGVAEFNGDYIYINVNSISINGIDTPVKFTGYKNGQRGIYARETANKDIVKENINQNTSGGVRVTVPGVPISGTINPQINKKTGEKSASLFVPSQSSMVLNPVPPNN